MGFGRVPDYRIKDKTVVVHDANRKQDVKSSLIAFQFWFITSRRGGYPKRIHTQRGKIRTKGGRMENENKGENDKGSMMQ